MINWLTANGGAFDSLKSAISILAIIVAGLWTWKLFVQNRENKAKADIQVTVEVIPLPLEKNLVKPVITIKNLGKVVLKTEYMQMSLSRIIPLSPEIEKMVKTDNSDIVYEGKNRVEWPVIANREWNNPFTIEPGESQDFSTDFLIEKDDKVLELYIFIDNPKHSLREVDAKHGWTKKMIISAENMKPTNQSRHRE